jgi:alcohol dehydrogenase YqhD (iron-dependent ADH family)
MIGDHVQLDGYAPNIIATRVLYRKKIQQILKSNSRVKKGIPVGEVITSSTGIPMTEKLLLPGTILQLNRQAELAA